MKKMIYVTLILMVAFTLLPSAMAQDLKVISLKWSDYAPPSAGGNVFMKQEYVPRLNEQLAKIGYKLEITYYHAASLYKQQDQVQAVEDGLIDITTLVPSYEKARCPLHEVVTFPLMGWDCYGGSRIWFELQKTIPEFGAEFSKYKELFHFMPMPAILNANKVLRVPTDFKGVKILSSGMMGDTFRSIGAVPIRQSPTDFYTSLERGLVEAINIGIYGVTMFKLQEVVKVHVVPYGDCFGFPSISVIMNRKKYDSFPPGVQKAIDDQVQWATERINAIDDAHNPEAEEICRKKGNTFINLTPDEMKLWYAAVKPMKEKWIEEMEAKGLPGRKVLEEAMRLSDKYKRK